MGFEMSYKIFEITLRKGHPARIVLKGGGLFEPSPFSHLPFRLRPAWLC